MSNFLQAPQRMHNCYCQIKLWALYTVSQKKRQWCSTL